jgi:hypothetical protein
VNPQEWLKSERGLEWLKWAQKFEQGESLLVSIVIFAFELVATKGQRKRTPQYKWLFEVAGIIKGYQDRTGTFSDVSPAELSGFVKAFAEIITSHEAEGANPSLDWSDWDEVEINFEQAFIERDLPKHSFSLEQSIEYAKSNFETLHDLKLNKYAAQIACMAYFLHIKNRGRPFLIPINKKTSKLLGVSPMTISASLSDLIRRDLIRIHEEKYSASARKARLLTFNPDHQIAEYLQASEPDNPNKVPRSDIGKTIVNSVNLRKSLDPAEKV